MEKKWEGEGGGCVAEMYEGRRGDRVWGGNGGIGI